MSMQQPQQYQQEQQQQNQQQQRWNYNKTIVTVEAVAPSQEAFTHLTQQLMNTPGLKEVSLRREGRNPKIRIQATRESLPNIQNILNQVVQTVQQSYSSSSNF